jgi:membrane-associated phospholipid phosphatase
MKISDESYLNWQKRLLSGGVFRWFWLFCGVYILVIVLGLSIYLYAIGQRKVILITLMALVIARLIISPLIFYFYQKPRPYQKLNYLPVGSLFGSLLFSPNTLRHTSYPSDHALSFAAITTVFFWYSPILGSVMILASILNGCGRVILGYHYAIDIISGWIIGIVCGCLVIYWLAPILFR